MIGIIFVSSVVIVGVWALIANNLTFKQRGRIADIVFAQSDWRAHLRAYDRISYDAHMWRVFTLRSPWKLYAPEMQALLAEVA